MKFDIGQTHPQNNTTLRILAVQGDDALLEQWKGDKLIQYIVTRNLFIDDDEELHWRGSGAYFTCGYPPPICDTPYVALCKAISYMKGPQMIYILVADVDDGTWMAPYTSMDEAKAALQKELDANENLQEIAASLGIERLTADKYIVAYAEFCSDFLDPRDYYHIEEFMLG